MKPKKRVTLETQLEIMAGNLMPHERIALAEQFCRWAHQLEFSALLLRRGTTQAPKKLRRMSEKQLLRN